MSSGFLGRQRRAVVVSLFVLGALVGQTRDAFAEQRSYGGDDRKQDAVILDDAVGTTSCDSESCESFGVCNQCGDKGLFAGWIGAEYLGWTFNGSELPPLVTASPATTPRNQAGVLDGPATQILDGDETVNDDWRSGYRIFAGLWLDCAHSWSISGDYFDVGDDDFHFLSANDPDRIVARPFFNTELGQEDAEFVSVPIELDGTVGVNSQDDFNGGGLAINYSLCRCCNPCAQNTWGLTLLGGYRYYSYDSDLEITENLTVLPGTTTPLLPGTTFLLQDSFRTHNEFNGGEIGLRAFRSRRKWWFDGMAKVAMGGRRRTVTVDGQTVVVVPGGGSATAAGGLLTSEVTNIGRYEDSDFALIPEFRLGAGFKITRRFSVHAGYNVILWSEVAQAASHLPPGLRVDPRNLPPVQAGGGVDPQFPGIRGSQFVAHGFDASVMLNW